MDEGDVDVGGFKRTLKDLGAGAAGGIAQVLLGWSECYVTLFAYWFSATTFFNSLAFLDFEVCISRLAQRIRMGKRPKP